MSLLVAVCVSFIIFCTVHAEVVLQSSNLQSSIYNVFKEFRNYAELRLNAELGGIFSPDPDYPYWNVFPTLVDHAFADAEPLQWSSKCFSENTMSVKYSGDFSDPKRVVTVTVKSSGPLATWSSSAAETEVECVDFYLFICTSASVDFIVRNDRKPLPAVLTTSVDVVLPDDVTDAEWWDIENRGFRLMEFPFDPRRTLSNLLVTLDLFKPKVTDELTPEDAEHNRRFINSYTHTNDIQPIEPSSVSPPPAEAVHSGDFFGLLGLDGLSTMMAFAMGTTTGHTTTALWIDDVLHVCESNAGSITWPVNGIQCTEYSQWLDLVRHEGHQVVWAPLRSDLRDVYNATAALAFFHENKGLDYGFRTLLWSWIDTAEENFPCLPPDYSNGTNCISWDFFEPALALFDRNFPDIGKEVWNAGMAKRLGVSDELRTSDLYQVAATQFNLSSTDVITMPEQDSWVYNTTRDGEPAVGKDMVCCVFVCNMWKAAGLFGDLTNDFNCGELTNWDVYVLTVLDPSYTQILGNYSMELQFDYNSREPYAQMGEHCPGLPPDYPKDPHC